MTPPPRPLRTAPITAACLALMLLLGACEQTQINTNAPQAQAYSFQAKTLRSLLSEAGVERLLEDEYPQGIPLESDAQASSAFGLELSTGPIAQRFEVGRWQAQMSAAQLDISVEADGFLLTVPMRVRDASQGNHATRICRFTVAADQAVLGTQASLDTLSAPSGTPLPILSPTGTPQVALSAARVEPVGACPPIDALDSAQIDAIHQRILTYLEQAFADSIAAAITLSPVESLGLLHAPAAVERLSNFENRRGELWVNGRMSASGIAGAQLGADGLQMDMDIALNSQRAACAPALVADAPGAAAAGPVAQADLAGSHAAIALATPVLARLAQASVSAGFTCRGLEDSAIEPGSANRGLQIPTESLNLEAVGLSGLAGGPETHAQLIAGGLPTVSTDPANAALNVNWEALSVDLYAEIQGVRVRVLQMRADLALSLHLRSQGWSITQNQVRFTLDALEISEVSIESQWSDADLSQAGEDPAHLNWARRAWLLILEDFFHFPLPIMPDSSLRLDSAQVRSDDLLLRFKFDRIF